MKFWLGNVTFYGWSFASVFLLLIFSGCKVFIFVTFEYDDEGTEVSYFCFQAAMNKVEHGVERDLLYDQFSEKDDIWFDFMADTGDGGNSSYTVARLLAQPSLRVTTNESVLSLPRGNLLLIGGDLA